MSPAALRLQTELARLYPAADAPDTVRTLVIELACPADWSRLAAVWQAVQTELDLPAPAVAVNGVDGHQLWFSLAEPVLRAQAAALLHGLQTRHLADLPARRVSLFPSVDGARPAAPAVPALQPGSDHWSAFVLPGLAPMFADEAWLDMPPSPEAQTDLLARLEPIRPAEFERALALLQPAPAAESLNVTPHALRAAETRGPGAARIGPTQFLLDVVNDRSATLALRIDAAKALLAHGVR